MAGVVDADTHIAESEAMWGYIDKETYPRRPILAKIPEDTWYKERNAFWLIDGEIFPKPAGKGSFSLTTPSAQKKDRHRLRLRPQRSVERIGVREKYAGAGRCFARSGGEDSLPQCANLIRAFLVGNCHKKGGTGGENDVFDITAAC